MPSFASYSFNKYLGKVSYVPGADLGPWGTALNKTKFLFSFHWRDSKQVKKLRRPLWEDDIWVEKCVKTAELWDRLREVSLREWEMKTNLVYSRKWKEAAWLEEGKDPKERWGREVVRFW